MIFDNCSAFKFSLYSITQNTFRGKYYLEETKIKDTLKELVNAYLQENRVQFNLDNALNPYISIYSGPVKD